MEPNASGEKNVNAMMPNNILILHRLVSSQIVILIFYF